MSDDFALSDTHIEAIKQLSLMAGQKILEYYTDSTRWHTQTKSNNTPVTAADLAANRIIQEGLARLTPQWPFLSEESEKATWSERQHWTRYWLVDPLDGTKEFLHQTGEFTVNIALIEKNRPVFGWIYWPTEKRLYWGGADWGAWQQTEGEAPVPIHSRALAEPVKLLVSRRHQLHAESHIEHFLVHKKHTQANTLPLSCSTVTLGSSLKLCYLACSEGDIYLRLGPTSEWDIAAGQAILEGSGGAVLTPQPLHDDPLIQLTYNNKASFENPAFVAVGDPRQEWRQIFQFSTLT